MPPYGLGPSHDGSGAGEGVPLCPHCNDVIGFYGPIVLLVDGQPPLLSSRAAAPLAADDVAFHQHCFRQGRARPG